jgi:hypothetical protein
MSWLLFSLALKEYDVDKFKTYARQIYNDNSQGLKFNISQLSSKLLEAALDDHFPFDVFKNAAQAFPNIWLNKAFQAISNELFLKGSSNFAKLKSGFLYGEVIKPYFDKNKATLSSYGEYNENTPLLKMPQFPLEVRRSFLAGFVCCDYDNKIQAETRNSYIYFGLIILSLSIFIPINKYLDSTNYSDSYLNQFLRIYNQSHLILFSANFLYSYFHNSILEEKYNNLLKCVLNLNLESNHQEAERKLTHVEKLLLNNEKNSNTPIIR